MTSSHGMRRDAYCLVFVFGSTVGVVERLGLAAGLRPGWLWGFLLAPSRPCCSLHLSAPFPSLHTHCQHPLLLCPRSPGSRL